MVMRFLQKLAAFLRLLQCCPDRKCRMLEAYGRGEDVDSWDYMNCESTIILRKRP